MEVVADKEKVVIYTDHIPSGTTLTIGQAIYIGVSEK